MSRFEHSLPPSYFEALYARDPDPWRFAQSDYERDKYAATLAALPRSQYSCALEVGCSIGILTRQLADRCDTLLALDVAAAPLEQARVRCAALNHVRFEQSRVPTQWPQGPFDLILLSEVVYYLDSADVRQLAARVDEVSAPGCDIILVHWLGETHYPLSGDDASEQFIAACSAHPVRSLREKEYRLDVLHQGGN